MSMCLPLSHTHQSGEDGKPCVYLGSILNFITSGKNTEYAVLHHLIIAQSLWLAVNAASPHPWLGNLHMSAGAPPRQAGWPSDTGYPKPASPLLCHPEQVLLLQLKSNCKNRVMPSHSTRTIRHRWYEECRTMSNVLLSVQQKDRQQFPHAFS